MRTLRLCKIEAGRVKTPRPLDLGPNFEAFGGTEREKSEKNRPLRGHMEARIEFSHSLEEALMSWSIGAQDWLIFVIEIMFALAIGALVYWAWWVLPKQLVCRLNLETDTPKSRADAADVENKIRNTIGQAIGIVALLIGTFVAYFDARQTNQAAHDQLFSQQVSNGFKLLAGKSRVERLGGIYALEGVMNNSKQYFKPILEGLSAYVREETRPRYDPNEKADSTCDAIEKQPAICDAGHRQTAACLSRISWQLKPPDADIQASLTVMARRGSGEGHVDLTDARIRRAFLNDANLKHAEIPHAWLCFAHLTRAKLESANLSGTNLKCACLMGAELSQANLSGTDLTGADLTGANLIGAIVSQAQLDNACGTNASLPQGLVLEPCPPNRQ
jgi:hypothetical protein